MRRTSSAGRGASLSLLQVLVRATSLRLPVGNLLEVHWVVFDGSQLTLLTLTVPGFGFA